jgi:hypothetical protein
MLADEINNCTSDGKIETLVLTPQEHPQDWLPFVANGLLHLCTLNLQWKSSTLDTSSHGNGGVWIDIRDS